MYTCCYNYNGDMMTNVTFRNVDDNLFTEFKVEATRLKKNLGEAITEAINLWLYNKKRKLDIKKIEKDPFLQSIRKPIDTKLKTSSKTIDKELYG